MAVVVGSGLVQGNTCGCVAEITIANAGNQARATRDQCGIIAEAA
jgi:hypothetical protein